MTKEQFLKKWVVGDKMPPDLEAVIATEIAKAKVQPALNPIEEAYHNYEPIKYKKWEKFQWIKKHSEFEAKTENGAIFNVVSLNFTTHPEKWEIYTDPTEKPAKAFDKERFEAMFRAVVASGVSNNEFITTEEILEELDAYYATKQGGNNE